MLPSYTIITKAKVYEAETEEIYAEQEEKCKVLGIDTGYFAKETLIHYFDSPFMDEATQYDTVYDALQTIAIKDGVDLVQFESGNYGFVAYYNGIKNGFEIL